MEENKYAKRVSNGEDDSIARASPRSSRRRCCTSRIVTYPFGPSNKFGMNLVKDIFLYRGRFHRYFRKIRSNSAVTKFSIFIRTVIEIVFLKDGDGDSLVGVNRMQMCDRSPKINLRQNIFGVIFSSLLRSAFIFLRSYSFFFSVKLQYLRVHTPF